MRYNVYIIISFWYIKTYHYIWEGSNISNINGRFITISMLENIYLVLFYVVVYKTPFTLNIQTPLNKFRVFIW